MGVREASCHFFTLLAWLETWYRMYGPVIFLVVGKEPRLFDGDADNEVWWLMMEEDKSGITPHVHA